MNVDRSPDDQLLLDLRAWLLGEAVEPPDPERAGSRIAAALPREQASASRTLPWRRWRPQSADTLDDTVVVHAEPAAALDGHQPPVTRRTPSMLTPVKAIAAGTLVLILAVSFAIIRPAGPMDILPPGAERGTSTDATRITGTVLHAPSCVPPTREVEAEVVRERGWRCEPQVWQTSDPRLTGTGSSTWHADVYRFDGSDASVIAETYELKNESGAWRCRSELWMADGSGLYASTVPTNLTCAGQGAYEGQLAVLKVDMDEGTVDGVILTGDPPPWPEPVTE